jgi:hypothetical protein
LLPVVGERRTVLDEFEAQCLHVEADGAVVVVDDDRCVLDVHPSNVDDLPSVARTLRHAESRTADTK